jgi:uncharacterized protein
MLVGRSKNIILNTPIMVAGFPDSGMVGSIAMNHLIEQLGLHQIAYIESQYVMPAALYVAGRFRHPFRIYSNSGGTLCALICEAPTMAKGTYSISDAIIGWCLDVLVNEVIVIGGISTENFTSSNFGNRKALLLRNKRDDGTFGSIAEDLGQASVRDMKQNIEITVPNTALIAGLAGALLSSCVVRDLQCTGLLVPTGGITPDPEAAAILLEALGLLVPKVRVNTSTLSKQAEAVKKHLEEHMKMYHQSMGEYERSTTPEVERMYK